MSDIYFIIIGVILTATGIIYPALTIRHRIACKEKVTATVVSVETKRYDYGDRKSTKYLPTFSYTVDGRQYTAKSDSETVNMLKYKAGNEVIIRYNPDNPEQICVGTKVFPFVAGALFSVIGITSLILYFK